MSTLLKPIVFSSSLLFATSIVNAASFDCKKAGTFIEHTICNDDKLSKLDEDLVKAYKNAKKHTDKKVLQKEQINWIKKDRAACKDVQCLRDTYTQRVNELNAYGKKNSAFPDSVTGKAEFCHTPAGAAKCIVDKNNKYTIVVGLGIDDKIWNKLEQAEEKSSICTASGTLWPADGGPRMFNDNKPIKVMCH